MPAIDHLLVIAPGFPADESDENCIPYFQDYLHLLMAAYPKLKIRVIALQYPYKRGTYIWNGIEVHALGGKNSRILKPWIWRMAKRRFNRIHRQQPVEAIHSLWLQDAAWLGMKIAKRHNIRHIATAMGQDVVADNRWLKRMDWASMTVVGLSERSQAVFEAVCKRPFDAVLPFAEPPLLFPATLPQRGIDVLGVGSLIPSKKFDRFLRVIRLVADQRADIKVVLVGDGPQKQALKAKCKELGLEGNVRFEGLKSRIEVMNYMLHAKVFLHPSLAEGQGYVFTEAQNRGMAIVSAPIGIAEAGKHWAVHMDAVRMADAVLGFLDAPAPKMADQVTLNAAAATHLTTSYMEFYAGK